jgi:hypothetical protein
MLRGLRTRFFNEKRAKKKDDLLNCSAIGLAARHHSPMRVNGHHGHSASGNREGQRRQDNDLLHGGLPSSDGAQKYPTPTPPKGIDKNLA